MIKVLIADDHDIVREGVKQIVSETPDISVGGEARSGAEALEEARKRPWDVVILDLNLPDRPGLDVLTQLRTLVPHTPVLILSMHTHVSYATRLLKAGAAGYVSKDSAREHLVAAIRRLARGERYLPPAFAENLAFDLMDAACGITRRVAHGAAQLERNIEIARDALAVGIDHRKDCLASECTLCAAVHLSISAFARFHGIGGLSESVIRVQ